MTNHADEPSAPGAGVSANDLTSRSARRSAEQGGTLRPRRLPAPSTNLWAPSIATVGQAAPVTVPPGQGAPARAVPIATTGAATAASPEQQRYYLCCEVPSGDFVEVIVAVTDGARRRYFTTSDGARLVEVDEDYFVHRSLGDARSLLELDAREMAELEAELGFVRTVRGRDPLAEVALEVEADEPAEADAPKAEPDPAENAVPDLEPEFEFGFEATLEPEPEPEPEESTSADFEPLLASLLPVGPIGDEIDADAAPEASASPEPEPLDEFDHEAAPTPAPIAGTPWWLAPAPSAEPEHAQPEPEPEPEPDAEPVASPTVPQPSAILPPMAPVSPLVEAPQRNDEQLVADVRPAPNDPTDQTDRPDLNEETDRMVTGTTNAFEQPGGGASVTPIWAVAPQPDADAVVAAAAQVALAKGIAFVAHRGQVDKVGAAYIDHPGRVAERFDPIAEPVASAAAWLHDVIEDTGLTAQELLEAGVLPEVVEIVVLLTRTPEVPEAEYYGRIRRHAVARSVKIADVDDNSAAWRVRKLDFETQQRLADKYRHAREMLGA
ncbi:hypothetical protein MUN74_11965 [Agromyces endophyticus]|uniref:hypothetical protein n=1 Tax=Agromyces sp. H17E-10 TaxID=2932244 RepID=UPI001FD11A3A|nr:hypothetical protein [Agromyces sp. H17E-10]UOQ88009.1 hypothetical protein MUN74_11965 [Agromyces sp. H17E-10]